MTTILKTVIQKDPFLAAIRSGDIEKARKIHEKSTKDLKEKIKKLKIK